jgi:hypothetical protein
MKKSIMNYSNTKIKNNLKRWFETAKEQDVLNGKNWYKEAQDFSEYLSLKYNLDTYTCATIISCLSPNNRWERNKVDAEAVIVAHKNGIAPESIKVCTYTTNKLKAFRCLDGEMIGENAPKTHAFAMNVGKLSTDHVTIDKWHLRTCMIRPSEGIQPCVETLTAKQYRRVERVTSELAKEFNLKGYEFQAILWVTIKNKWNR